MVYPKVSLMTLLRYPRCKRTLILRDSNQVLTITTLLSAGLRSPAAMHLVPGD